MEGGNGPGDGRPQVARRLRTSAAHEWYGCYPQTWMGTSPEVQKWPFREEDYLLEVTTNIPVSIKANRSRLVVRLESLRIILALAAIRDLDVIHFDITSAHLHGILKEGVYVEQPEGYVAPGKEEGPIRVSAGWENVECGDKHSRGESGTYKNAQGSAVCV